MIGSEVVAAGAPLLALEAVGAGSSGLSGAHGAPGVAFTRLIFIEGSEAAAGELRSAIAERGGDDRVEVVVGDVNVELPRVLEGVERTTPVFVTLFANEVEPAWSTVEQIAAWNVELLVSFPLQTTVSRGSDRALMGRYFGDTGWESDWGRGEYGAVREFYQDRLRSLGWTRQADDALLVKEHDPVGHKDYWLIHAARREAEQGVWQWVLRRMRSAPG